MNLTEQYPTMKPAVSVIIAIYNAEKWLRRCIKSALAQSLKDIEVLLIDDGSTDASPAICDEFAAIDTRVRVFHHENQGISITRQFGIDHAEGEYLVYLDSDDFLDPTIYEKMYRGAQEQNADVVVCDWYSVYGNTMYPEDVKVKRWDAEHLLYALIQDQPTYQTIFLCRRALFDKLAVGFPRKRISYGEDTMMMISLLNAGITSAEGLTLYHVPEPLYYYDRTINPGSLMKLSKKEMAATRLALWSAIGAELRSGSLKKALNNRLVYYLFSSVLNNYFTAEELQSRYASWLPDIKQYASDGIKKRIVVRSLEGKIALPFESKWMALPGLLQEKWAQHRRKYKALPVPSELAAL